MNKFFQIFVILVLVAPLTTMSSCHPPHLDGIGCPSGDCDGNGAYNQALMVGQTFTATVQMAPSSMNNVPFTGDNGVNGVAVSSGTLYQNYFKFMTAPIRVTVKVDQELRDPNGGPSMFTFRIIGVY